QNSWCSTTTALAGRTPRRTDPGLLRASIRPTCDVAGQGFDHGNELARIDWFGDVQLEPGAESAGPILGACVSRQGGRRDPAQFRNGEMAYPLDELESVHSRHPDIADQHVRVNPLQSIERLSARLGSRHRCAGAFEHLPDEHERIAIVVY